MAKRPQGLARNISLTRNVFQSENAEGQPKPITMLTEDETMMKETGRFKFLFLCLCNAPDKAIRWKKSKKYTCLKIRFFEDVEKWKLVFVVELPVEEHMVPFWDSQKWAQNILILFEPYFLTSFLFMLKYNNYFQYYFISFLMTLRNFEAQEYFFNVNLNLLSCPFYKTLFYISFAL